MTPEDRLTQFLENDGRISIQELACRARRKPSDSGTARGARENGRGERGGFSRSCRGKAGLAGHGHQSRRAYVRVLVCLTAGLLFVARSRLVGTQALAGGTT